MADDYGNTAGTAGTLSIGGQVTGKLELPDDRDWFSVTLAAGTTYWFELSGTTAAGASLPYPVLKVFDTSTTGLANGIFDTNGIASIAFTPLTAGTYYLQARQQSVAADSSYTLKAQVAPLQDDYRDDLATTGRLTVGGQATGNFEVLNDRDAFRVELVAGTTYAFSLLSAKQGGGTAAEGLGSRFTLTLSNAEGSHLPLGGQSSNNEALVRTVTPKTSGSYYLYAAPAASTGTYTVKAALASNQASNDIGANDVFLATPGDDTFDGGTGIDRVIFSGPKSDYVIVRPTGGFNSTVTGKGTDHLTGVERVEFQDIGLAFDMSGSAGAVLRAMGAIFGTFNVTTRTEFIADGLRKLDGGMSFETYMQQNLDAVLGPNATSEQVVRLLYGNVGPYQDPPETALAYYTSLLDDGVVTTDWLAVYAANHSLNVIHTVGYEKGGLVYAI